MLVMNYFGVPFSAAVYIPFVGAFVGMKAPPKDAWQDAVIAFGGPVLGTVAAGATSLAAVSTDSQLLFALAVRKRKKERRNSSSLLFSFLCYSSSSSL
jgi:hypothetical protein